ncbi:MAG: hypothetical protein ACRDP1_13280, partial [Nocardioidaceae bacterium]
LRCTKTATAVAVTVDQTTVTAPARLGDLDTSAPLLVGVEPITTTRKREQLVGSVDNVVVRVGGVAAKDTP